MLDSRDFGFVDMVSSMDPAASNNPGNHKASLRTAGKIRMRAHVRMRASTARHSRKDIARAKKLNRKKKLRTARRIPPTTLKPKP